jgi:putative tryptophan/tyrosine transport system substrate-binding protein
MSMKKSKALLFIISFVMVLSFVSGESYNILLLETMPVPVVEIHSRAIQDELQILSTKRDLDIDLEVFEGMGDKDLCIEYLNTYLDSKTPDLVITVATLATQAAVQVFKDTEIPILFCVVVDPVGSEIVKEVGVPSNSNISGVVYSYQRNTKVEMVMRIIGNSYQNSGVKFGIVSSDYPSSVGDIRELYILAEAYDNIEFISYQFPYERIPERLPQVLANFQKGIDELKDQVDFFWEVGGPLAEIEVASQMIIDSGMPLIMGNTQKAVELGALISVATNYQETGKQIVEMVDQIIEGQYVGSIAVTNPRLFDLYINVKTANELELKIPSHILMIAGNNIFY